MPHEIRRETKKGETIQCFDLTFRTSDFSMTLVRQETGVINLVCFENSGKENCEIVFSRKVANEDLEALKNWL